MQFLTDQLKCGGVEFLQRRIERLEDLHSMNHYDAIINCTGLCSATSVVHDKRMYPIRGQVLRVKAPWINNVWLFGSSYIIPNVDSVVLGGTADKDVWDTTVSLTETTKILDDIAQVVPSIRDAQIESVWVGLRPGRSSLRLDSEVIVASADGRRKQVLVGHCYGHGGNIGNGNAYYECRRKSEVTFTR
jgi:D-amino-acid oxidase